jgi:hypothetical protein
MNHEKIHRVVFLIREFLDRTDLLLNDEYPIVGTKESGALRRTSMELTRALSDLRRPG